MRDLTSAKSFYRFGICQFPIGGKPAFHKTRLSAPITAAWPYPKRETCEMKPPDDLARRTVCVDSFVDSQLSKRLRAVGR